MLYGAFICLMIDCLISRARRAQLLIAPYIIRGIEHTDSLQPQMGLNNKLFINQFLYSTPSELDLGLLLLPYATGYGYSHLSPPGFGYSPVIDFFTNHFFVLYLCMNEKQAVFTCAERDLRIYLLLFIAFYCKSNKHIFNAFIFNRL